MDLVSLCLQEAWHVYMPLSRSSPVSDIVIQMQKADSVSTCNKSVSKLRYNINAKQICLLPRSFSTISRSPLNGSHNLCNHSRRKAERRSVCKQKRVCKERMNRSQYVDQDTMQGKCEQKLQNSHDR